MLTKEERFEVWSEYLSKEGGVTQTEMENVFALKDSAREGDKISYNVRKDLSHIRKLLKWKGLTLLEIGKKNKRLKLNESVDLKKLLQEEKVSQPYKDLMEVLLSSTGLLPDSFLGEICSVYREMSENTMQSKSISFDADYDLMVDSMDIFSEIYKALNKHAIWISHHPVNKPDCFVEGIFYPEYLKQYRSNWYAFGMFEDDGGKEPVFQKIPINNIDDYDDERCNSYPFVHSNIVNYEEYFDDIIGVENPEANKVETIKFRISNRMFQRIKNKPLHSSQLMCRELDTAGYKGMKLNVKYNIELLRTILNLGADIEIVEPVHIRKRVKQVLMKTLKMYER